MTVCRDVDYGDFGSRLVRAGLDSRIPLSGSMELTFRCNLRCVHCYVADFSGDGELATGEIKRILEEIADAGCLWLLLTGGEVLCRNDFPEIYMHAKRLGFLVTVFSNATLMNEAIADMLAEYPPFSFEITLYGLSDETYLRTTGFPGRFTRVRRAIDLLLSRRVPLTLKAVAMEPLRNQIREMQAFSASLGVRFRYDAIVHGRLDGSLAPTAVRSSPGTVASHDARDPERLDQWMQFFRSYVATSRPSSLLMSCGAGLNSFHVDPRGTLLSCEALPLNGYDLRRGSFQEGWYGTVGDIRKKAAGSGNVCSGCELKAMCDRCPATAMLETGSPDGWIPYYCEITHRRAALIQEKLGNRDRAAEYRAHAGKVAAGWTPPGAILPSSAGATRGVCHRETTDLGGEKLIRIRGPRREARARSEVHR